ncbi:YkvI family membrane protein [Clostridium aminobutyricum]|uniref:Branched-chain amino acid transport system II carrier protein n=1 Tax=Clostridium aminobutyricum TaxID=33953 RepID=A0A939DAE1_CLOAM|nr:hypothetical protein [Clostridium aminobutyricum]MBN7774096.1 hypothetical protein [Clostridium aminobutyricum]
MEKQSISIKKVTILAGAFCAYMIGSGFSTGQEVLQFFSVYGVAKGIISTLVYAAITIWLIYTLYGTGQKMQFSNPYDVFEYYCGKYIGKFYTWYSVVLLYGIYVVMLAGAGATINQYFGIPAYIGGYGVAILALLTALLGVEKLINIIGVIGPIKIVFMIVVGVSAFITMASQPNLLSENSALIQTVGFQQASGNWLWSGILYAFLGLVFGNAFFVMNGQTAKNLREARLGGVIGAIALAGAVILLIIAENVYLDVIEGQQVPTLAIANHISPALGLIFALIIVLCIYSAVSSILQVVTRNFAVDKTKKFNILATVLTVVGMFGGMVLPFDKMVNLLYVIAAYSGIVLTGFMIYKEFINKNAFPFRKSNDENKDVDVAV